MLEDRLPILGLRCRDRGLRFEGDAIFVDFFVSCFPVDTDVDLHRAACR